MQLVLSNIHKIVVAVDPFLQGSMYGGLVVQCACIMSTNLARS